MCEQEAVESVRWRLERLERAVGEAPGKDGALFPAIADCLAASKGLCEGRQPLARFFALHPAADVAAANTESLGAAWVGAHGRAVLAQHAPIAADAVVRAETAAVLLSRTVPSLTQPQQNGDGSSSSAAVYTSAPEHSARLAAVAAAHAEQVARIAALRSRALALCRANAAFVDAVSARIAALDALCNSSTTG